MLSTLLQQIKDNGDGIVARVGFKGTVAEESIDLMMNIAGEWNIRAKFMDGIYSWGILQREDLLSDVLSGHQKTLSLFVIQNRVPENSLMKRAKSHVVGRGAVGQLRGHDGFPCS